MNAFLKYVRVYTTSSETSETHPTTARQFDLARQLEAEMKELGLEGVRVDRHGYVFCPQPGLRGKPAIGLIAHMDTSPDAPGEHVNPRSTKNYDGGDVVFPATGEVMAVASFPELVANRKGQTPDHGGRHHPAGSRR